MSIVVGLQYYHAASILMTIHKPRPQSPAGFQAARLMRIEEVGTLHNHFFWTLKL